ncbi:NAD-dependent glycerol-3-phosphate dehydrogenase family protein [Mycobacterium xenopi 4042]|uniref:NAD-dependent glycerol-3-phosphate dehydrogenase family protein n=1 Tax=Mycobacterium xenopi 4042 TaxID=1299334 RepID=X8CAK5_MYCXE|nr:NAD-dependent glycerol-3-phosphate dehydrogenase family protein [Mycobacterium xenopi 4042]
MNQVAEGVKAASVVMEFADKYGLSMPIAREVDAVINHGSTVEQAYRGLMAEKPGHEIHGPGSKHRSRHPVMRGPWHCRIGRGSGGSVPQGFDKRCLCVCVFYVLLWCGCCVDEPTNKLAQSNWGTCYRRPGSQYL